MCGRYASTRSSADLSALFEADDETDGALVADYNVAPTDPVAIVRHTVRTPHRVVSVARWGLVPPWSKDPSGAARMINARAETVATSRAFAQAYERRRCLVPADGWYEWLKPPGAAAGGRGGRRAGAKQPYFMTRRDGEPVAFAGVWSVWGAGDTRLLTCSVITVAAAGELALVHDRMPLAVPPEDFLAGIELRPVGVAVGDVRNDGPDLIRAVLAPPLTESTVESENVTLF